MEERSASRVRGGGKRLPAGLSDQDLEPQLAEIVTGMLGLPGDPAVPGRTIVELGASSLDANRIAARIAAVLGVRVRVATVLSSTLPGLAAAVARALQEGEAAESRTGGADAPLTPAQVGIWMAQRIERDPMLYMEPVLVRLEAPVPRERIAEAVRFAAGLNPALLGRVRTVTSSSSSPVLDEAVTEPDVWLRPSAGVRTVVDELEREPIDVLQGPLSRFILYGDHELVAELVVVVHHLVCDGAGLHRLLSDLVGALAGRPPRPRSPLRFSDFLRLKRAAPADPRRVQALAERLEAHLVVPPPVPRGQAPSATGTRTAETWRRISIDRALLAAVRAAAGRAGWTTFAAVGAAFAVAISERCGGCDFPLCVGASEQHDHPRFAEVVGHYVNLLPVLVGGQGGLPAAATAITDALLFRDVHVLEVVGAMRAGRRGVGSLARFGVTTAPSYRELAQPPVAVVRPLHTGHAKMSALLTLIEDEVDAAIELSARTDEFPPADADRLLDRLRGHLQRLVA